MEIYERIDTLLEVDEDEAKFKPPAGAAKEAKKALKWKEEHGDEVDAGTKTGWTRANQLADREELSYNIVKRMYNFFNRHEKNKDIAPEHEGEPWKDNGYVAWLIWGGDAGRSWAEKIVKRVEKKEESLNESVDANRRELEASDGWRFFGVDPAEWNSNAGYQQNAIDVAWSIGYEEGTTGKSRASTLKSLRSVSKADGFDRELMSAFKSGLRAGKGLDEVIDASIFGDIDDEPREPSPSERMAEMLKDLRVGDTVKIGRHRFEIVKKMDDVSPLAKLVGTKGTKWYAIRATGLDPMTFGAFEMLGGGTHYAKRPKAEGEMVLV